MNEAEKKELEGIRYIQEQNNMEDMKTVLALYNKLSEKEIFHTPAGISFMSELREQLLAAPEIDNREIAGYREGAQELTGSTKRMDSGEECRIEQTLIREYRYKYYNSLLINLILAAALVIGFLITTDSKNVNIINYENQLLDKYSAWEEQLKERERIVTEREKELLQP